VLFTSYFAIFGRGIEADVAEVFLQKPESIPGIVKLYGVAGKGIPQSVGTHPTPPAGLGINQVR